MPQYHIDECRLAGGRRSMHVKCLKSPGAIRDLATIHSLQRLHTSLEQFN